MNHFSHFRGFLRQQLVAGHFPLWDPYLFCGQPFFADPVAMMAYPINYLTLLFPVPLGLGFYFFLHMFLAAAGMHFWLRSLKLRDSACRVGALVFALSGAFWWELIHPTVLAALAWSPWLMGCLERLSGTLSRGWAFFAGICFSMAFLSGHFQLSCYLFYFALAYFSFRFYVRKPRSNRGWRTWAGVIFFSFWGLLPILSQLIPATEYYQLSNRDNAALTYERLAGTYSLEPQSLYELVFPSLGLAAGDRMEMAIQRITDNAHIDNGFLGAMGYLGVWVPFLFFLAFQNTEKKAPILLSGLGLMALLAALGRYFPLHRVLCQILPGIGMVRAPHRFLFIYALLACVLLAYGWESLEKNQSSKRKTTRWLLYGSLYALVLMMIALIQPSQTWREMVALALGTIGLTIWNFTRDWKKYGKILFQIALNLPLLLCGWAGFSLGPTSNYDYEAHFPVFTFLKEKSKDHRYYFDRTLIYPVRIGDQILPWAFPVDTVMELGIRTNDGYNPLGLQKTIDIQGLPQPSLFKLMAIHGLVFGQDRGEASSFIHHTLGSVHLYEPKDTRGMVNAPFHIQLAPKEGDDIRMMAQKDFDPALQVILNEPLPNDIFAQLPGRQARLQYELLEESPDEQRFNITLGANSLVTFSEIVYPGWKAFLDGQPTRLLTADHTFRALFVPAGEHQVEFRFSPWWVSPLLFLMAAWILSVILYGTVLVIQRRGFTIETNKRS